LCPLLGTVDVAYYECLEFQVDLPEDLRLAPNIVVEVRNGRTHNVSIGIALIEMVTRLCTHWTRVGVGPRSARSQYPGSG